MTKEQAAAKVAPDAQQPELPPLVSVIVPVHNAEAYLAEALEGIQRQTLQDWELVVVDDASTDGSREVIAEFARTEPRCTAIYRAANGGAGPARNDGVQAARGRWVAFCDADDVWLPTKLEEQLRCAEQHAGDAEPVLAVGTFTHRMNAAGELVDAAQPTTMTTTEEFLSVRERGEPVTVVLSSMIVRRDAFEAVGGFRLSYQHAEDLDLWTRIGELGVVLNVGQFLTRHRLHGSSTTDDNFVRQQLHIDLVRENTVRRRRGLPELSYDAYLAWRVEHDAAGFSDHVRALRARALFRAAAIAAVNRQYLSAACSALRLAVRHPTVAVRGVSNALRHRVGRARPEETPPAAPTRPARVSPRDRRGPALGSGPPA